MPLVLAEHTEAAAGPARRARPVPGPSRDSIDVITVLDADGGIVSRDGPVALVFGDAAAAMAGQRLDDLLHPADRAQLAATLGQLRAAPDGSGGSKTQCSGSATVPAAGGT